jgi:hypothetical protein
MPQALNKVNSAVRDCLSQCYDANQPLAALAAYVVKLRNDSRWSIQEIDAVESRVVHMLAKMAGPSDSGILPAGLVNPDALPGP